MTTTEVLRDRRRAALETARIRSMAQDLVNWLWAFLFWAVGLAAIISPRRSEAWLAGLTRTIMFSVGGAALILCTLTIWREFRTVRWDRRRVPRGK